MSGGPHERQPVPDAQEHRLSLAKTIASSLVAIALIVGMTWIVRSPYRDETKKAALLVLGRAVGYIFGRETR